MTTYSNDLRRVIREKPCVTCDFRCGTCGWNPAEQLQLFLRDAGTESPYIVAKDGMFVVAVIVPTPLKASARLWLGAIHGNAAQIRDGE